MTLKEWNYIQVYLYKKYKIDPKNFKLVMNIASCIGKYKEEKFSFELVSEIDEIIKHLIRFLGKEE